MSNYLKAVIAVKVILIISVICCCIMKKIQPDTFGLYLVYVAIILILFTSVVCGLVFGV